MAEFVKFIRGEESKFLSQVVPKLASVGRAELLKRTKALTLLTDPRSTGSTVGGDGVSEKSLEEEMIVELERATAEMFLSDPSLPPTAIEPRDNGNRSPVSTPPPTARADQAVALSPPDYDEDVVRTSDYLLKLRKAKVIFTYTDDGHGGIRQLCLPSPEVPVGGWRVAFTEEEYVALPGGVYKIWIRVAGPDDLEVLVAQDPEGNPLFGIDCVKVMGDEDVTESELAALVEGGSSTVMILTDAQRNLIRNRPIIRCGPDRTCQEIGAVYKAEAPEELGSGEKGMACAQLWTNAIVELQCTMPRDPDHAEALARGGGAYCTIHVKDDRVLAATTTMIEGRTKTPSQARIYPCKFSEGASTRVEALLRVVAAHHASRRAALERTQASSHPGHQDAAPNLVVVSQTLPHTTEAEATATTVAGHQSLVSLLGSENTPDPSITLPWLYGPGYGPPFIGDLGGMDMDMDINDPTTWDFIGMPDFMRDAAPVSDPPIPAQDCNVTPQLHGAAPPTPVPPVYSQAPPDHLAATPEGAGSHGEVPPHLPETVAPTAPPADALQQFVPPAPHPCPEGQTQAQAQGRGRGAHRPVPPEGELDPYTRSLREADAWVDKFIARGSLSTDEIMVLTHLKKRWAHVGASMAVAMSETRDVSSWLKQKEAAAAAGAITRPSSSSSMEIVTASAAAALASVAEAGKRKAASAYLLDAVEHCSGYEFLVQGAKGGELAIDAAIRKIDRVETRVKRARRSLPPPPSHEDGSGPTCGSELALYASYEGDNEEDSSEDERSGRSKHAERWKIPVANKFYMVDETKETQFKAKMGPTRAFLQATKREASTNGMEHGEVIEVKKRSKQLPAGVTAERLALANALHINKRGRPPVSVLQNRSRHVDLIVQDPASTPLVTPDQLERAKTCPVKTSLDRRRKRINNHK